MENLFHSIFFFVALISVSNATDNSSMVKIVHVTDLHISAFGHYDRATDFVKFCDYLNKVIKPEVVIIGGDLTDSRTKNHVGSSQIVEEWKTYHKVLQKCQENSDIKWMDIRGNHDSFGIENRENDYFTQYSVTSNRSRIISEIISKNDGSYGVIGIDTTLSPGPKYPFNFFGYINNDIMEDFKITMAEIRNSTDFQLVFGHYPSNLITKSRQEWSSVMSVNSSKLVYICGHLHRIIPRMYSKQNEGFIELELGDWKNNKMFRIITIDKEKFRFNDVVFNRNEHENTFAVFQNPPDMTYFHPESFEDLLKYEYIEVLIFEDGDADSKYKLIIDDQDEYFLLKDDKLPNLYKAKWNTTHFLEPRMYSLKIVDADKSIIGSAQFSLNPISDFRSPKALSKLSLHMNVLLFSKVLFILAALGILIPLATLKIFHVSRSDCLPRNLIRTVSNRKTFYSLMISTLYVCIGPWSMGYFDDHQISFIFSYGILFTNGTFLPSDTNYFYGLLTFFPSLYLLTIGLSMKTHHRSNDSPIKFWLKRNWIFVLVLCIQMIHVILFFMYFSALASFVGICGIFSLIFIGFLWKEKAYSTQYRLF